MLQQDYKIVEWSWKNKVIIKSISLDEELDLFILLSGKNKNFTELFLNKILDFSIDNISKDNTYKDFTNILENLNSIIKIYREDDSKVLEDFSALIWVQNKNDLSFSNIGSPSAYLIRNTNEVIEITEKQESKKEFLYISEWKLEYSDTIIMATTRLLNYLSYSDFTDSTVWKKIEIANKNIKTILEDEKISKNIWFLTIRYNFINPEVNPNSLINKSKKIFIELMDNSIVKRILAYYMIAKDYFKWQSKILKNIWYLTIILISSFLLFSTISKIVWNTVETKKIQVNKNILEEAKAYVKLASENYNNPDIFNLNIEKAENIIKNLKEKKLFLNDVNLISDKLNIIKKQFNWIEIFDEVPEKLIYANTENNVVKILKSNKKTFLVTNKNIIWPILPGKTPKKVIYDWLKNDIFIDATPLWSSIYLLTKKWNIIEYKKNWVYVEKKIEKKDKPKKPKMILAYNSNLYIISNNQIIKYKQKANNFLYRSSDYLKAEDIKNIWEILDIAIDWGFYILKKDLNIVKFFSFPYRLENIRLDNLSWIKNYSINKNKDSNIKIKTRPDLRYVYILLNNKIWIFKPDVRRYQDVKALKYLGQIEASEHKIKDFYVDYDWEIILLNDAWVYKATFKENDWKLIVE